MEGRKEQRKKGRKERRGSTLFISRIDLNSSHLGTLQAVSDLAITKSLELHEHPCAFPLFLEPLLLLLKGWLWVIAMFEVWEIDINMEAGLILHGQWHLLERVISCVAESIQRLCQLLYWKFSTCALTAEFDPLRISPAIISSVDLTRGDQEGGLPRCLELMSAPHCFPDPGPHSQRSGGSCWIFVFG